MPVRLTQRDKRLLTKLIAARWLTTSQVQRLFFCEATLDAVRKRLRKLVQARYLRSFQPHQMAEALHAIGSNGKGALGALGLEVDLERTPPKQLQHFTGINDIRVAVESGDAQVIYFFAYWELARLGWTYPVIPDAVFSIALGKRKTFCAEYDRGSETTEQVFRKIRFYQEEPEGFAFDAVLIITETQGRITALGRYLRKRSIMAKYCFAATLAEIREDGIFAQIFSDLADPEAHNHKRSLNDSGVRSLAEVSCRKETSA